MKSFPRFLTAASTLLLLHAPGRSLGPLGAPPYTFEGKALVVRSHGWLKERKGSSWKAFSCNRPAAWAELRLPQGIRPGIYAVRLLLRAGTPCRTRWSLDGIPLAREFDGHRASREAAWYEGGPLRLGKGPHTLKFVLTSRCSQEIRLAQVRLEPAPGKRPCPAGAFSGLPSPREFSALVENLVHNVYPKEAKKGGHPYFWPNPKKRKKTPPEERPPAGWAGNTRDLYYQGKLFSPGDPKGRCYCCGLTFEVLFRAWKAWCKKKKRPFQVDHLDFDQLKAFRAHFFGSNGDLKCAGGAIPAWGLGFAVPPMKARPGDFVQFWRLPKKGRRPSGHSVIFLGWVKGRGRRPKALRYWSTQGATKGIGVREEKVGGPGGVDLSRVFAARVGWPPDI